MLFIRSLLFNILLFSAALIHSTLGLFTFPFSFKTRYKFITLYSRYMTYFAKLICGIDYVVEGKENLPNHASIVLSNHQSAWETLAFQVIFPPQTWVVKKELLQIPFFGWGFSLLDPIAIDRKLPATSMEQMLRQGKERLREGRWIIIFPEGTRSEAHCVAKFGRGGAYLAEETKTPVIPVVHNAGLFWPRRSFIKKPGTIKVVIGPVIETVGKDSFEINTLAKDWIEKKLTEILN